MLCDARLWNTGPSLCLESCERPACHHFEHRVLMARRRDGLKVHVDIDARYVHGGMEAPELCVKTIGFV